MIKIWGKILKEDKVLKHKTISVEPSTTTFFDMMKDLCSTLNIPTPVLLDKHVYDFNVFHMCTFKPDDFIEEVVFDKFILELVRKN